MCTLSVVPLTEGRVRLAFNRDEQRTRPPGLSPERRRVGDREAVLPTDPLSGGTWLAVNDAGLTLAILNATPPGDRPQHPTRRSRGAIIPTLLDVASPAAALGALEWAVRFSDHAPFRLVAVGRVVGANVSWDGREAMPMTRLLGGAPLLFTSSGLGDHLVEGVRRELFDAFFEGPIDEWEAAQDAFHRHRWPGRKHLSVNMERPDARTVSHAVIATDGGQARFRYHPAAPDEPAATTILDLPISAGVAA